MKVIYVRGGDKEAPEVARLSGMEYGSRNDYTVYAQPHMIDIHWTKYRWDKYLKVVSRWQPQIAMVADYERHVPAQQVYQQIADLKALGVSRVMVCPKFPGAVADIDREHMIAVSVPTEYAGFLPRRTELEGRDVHLLGGHPDQQAFLIHDRYSNAKVLTVDGNALALKAQKGQVWSQSKRDWFEVKSKVYSTTDLAIVSGKMIIHYLQHTPRWDMRKARMQRCMEYAGQLFSQEAA